MRLFTGAAAALIACAAPALAQDSAVPVFRISLDDGDSHEQGLALASQIKARFPDLERRYDAFLAQWLTQAHADAWINREMATTRASISADLRKEIDGLANGLVLTASGRLGDGRLSYEEFWLLQASPALISMAGGAAFGVEAPLNETGSAMVVRAWDGSAAVGLTDMTAITVINNGEGAVVLIGPAGLAGVINGFNDHGVFAALIDASEAVVKGVGVAALDLRDGLHGARRLGDVVARLNGGWRRDQTLFLADQTSARVLEAPAGQRLRLRAPGSHTRIETDWGRPGQIAAVGCFALATAPANCHDLVDLYRWRRLRALAVFSSTGPKAQASDMVAIATDRANGSYALNSPSTSAVIAFETRPPTVYLSITSRNARPASPQRYGGLITSKAAGWFAGWFEGIWLILAAVIILAGGALFYAKFKR